MYPLQPLSSTGVWPGPGIFGASGKVDSLRRTFNAVDRLLDRRALLQEKRWTRNAGGARRPVTARGAFSQVLPEARSLDPGARLKSIVSQAGVDADGASAHWEFLFDLPSRRAHLLCEWVLGWDEAIDGYTAPHIAAATRPFPPPESPVRQLVMGGQLLHRQLIGMWERERRRRPDLPHKFRDSDAALADFVRQGLDVAVTEFSLCTGTAPEGQISWLAQTRDRSYIAAFS
jgi:hypothetical protein